MADITPTTNIPLSDLLNKIGSYKYNPSAIQRTILNHLKNITEGKVNIVDPTNPFVFLLEASAVNTAAFMAQNEVGIRRQYPSLAQTEQDLYPHMSDLDYVGRFAFPASTRFSILINKDDMLKKMIDDPIVGGKKVIIARNSEFKVSDVVFSIQYPIVIRQLTHEGIQISYDTDILSPLKDLTTNIIDYQIRTDSNRVEWIYFEFEVDQFFIKTTTSPISGSSRFSLDIPTTDSYYHARVYFLDNNGVYKEIYTTHTDQVYDPNKPTAVLTVFSGSLNVVIPEIYINTKQVKGTLRVDIYETKGTINMVMENFQINAFSYELKTIDKARDASVYTAAMSNISFLAYCTKTVVGGNNKITFEQLRQKVIDNSVGSKKLPITNVQIEDFIDKRGYTIVKNIDVLTNRVFLATKNLPLPFDEKLTTAASASVQTLSIELSKLITFPGVNDNGKRVTLTPDLVYKNNAGILEVVDKLFIDNILSIGPDEIAGFVNSNNILFSPFHYVIDTENSNFELRPYYLNGPKINSLKFIDQNETTGLQVNTVNQVIEKTATGYKLTILTKSNDGFKDLNDDNVFVQLFYTPPNEAVRAYVNGTLKTVGEDKERIYEFEINSTFDVDSFDQMLLTNFVMFTRFSQPVLTPLQNSFGIVYGTNVTPPVNWITSSVDGVLGNVLLPDSVIGITHEEIDLTIGQSLKTLWSRSRTVAQSSPYKRYTENIPAFYEKDVYKIDPVTGAGFVIDENDELQFNILHRKNDPILDNFGKPVYKHKVGDVILDEFGNPIEDVMFIQRQLDLMLIEGAYYFATDTSSSKYKNDVINVIVDWLTIDLETINDYLLEQTKLFFYPKKTVGEIPVIVENGTVISIDSAQSFVVKLYVPATIFKNAELRNSIKTSTIRVIDSYLKKSVVSVSEITSALRVIYENDVVSVNLTRLGGNLNLETLTVKNDSDLLSIRKKLTRLQDDTLIVEEDIEVEFISLE